MARVPPTDVLAACSPTYRAIDLRVAAISGKEGWESAYTAIRLTPDTPAKVRARHKSIRAHHGVLHTEGFRIIAASLPFAEWPKVREDLAAGVVRCGGLSVQLREKMEFNGHTESVRFTQHYGQLSEDTAWPSLDLFAGNSTGRLGTDGIVRVVSSAGYLNGYQAVAALCEADTWPKPLSNDLVVRFPICAALSGVTYNPVEECLRVSLRRHRKLKGVMLQVIVSEGISRRSINRATITKFALETTSDGILNLTGTLARLQVRQSDSIEICLAHPVLGDLDRQTYEVWALLPAPERNLLLDVLTRFCPLEQLHSYMTDPAAQKSARADQSTAFEHHVAWLLSLLGFSPIVLGRHEHLQAGKVQQGSIDIIATRNHTLLLVACTISAPKSEDFTMLWHICTQVRDALAAHTRAIVHPVMVTGVTGTEPYRLVRDGEGIIPIIDVTFLGALIRDLPMRKPGYLSDFLLDPRFKSPRTSE